jgi:hypothetical protein
MYYIITHKRVKDQHGKYYAETLATDRSISYFKYSETKNVLSRCPKCGFTVSILDNIGAHAVQFDNENIPDFILNDTNIRYRFIVSEKALNLLESFPGIKSYVKVDVVLVRGKIRNDINLFLVEVEYSTAILSRKKSGLGMPVGPTDHKKCPVCNPDRKLYMTFHGITLENKEDDLDVFTIYDHPSFLFVSDQVLDRFRTLGLTNLVERSVPAHLYCHEILQFD